MSAQKNSVRSTSPGYCVDMRKYDPTVRIPAALLDAVNQAVARRPGATAGSWVAEAVAAKLRSEWPDLVPPASPPARRRGRPPKAG